MSAHDPVSPNPNEPANDLSLLDQVLGATRNSSRAEDRNVVTKLVNEAMKGTATRSKDHTTAVENAIATVERDISTQLERILHHPCFQALEATWRGLFDLVHRSETDALLKLRLFSITKNELVEDLNADCSRLHQKLAAARDDEGEDPYDVILADHDFTSKPDDIDVLGKLAAVALSAKCLLVASGSATLCGLSHWFELDDNFVLGTGPTEVQIETWDKFRASHSAQSLILAMPRVLARRPFGAATSMVEEFPFEEVRQIPASLEAAPKSLLLWTNPAFLVGALINDAFGQAGRAGVNGLFETGGRIASLICFQTRDEDGDPVINGPVEVFLDRHRDTELRALGFTPLHYVRQSESVVINEFGTPCQY